MIHLQIPELMPDELIVGYLGRIGAVNGIRNESELRTVLRKSYKQQNGQDSDGSLIEHLAQLSGMNTYHLACHHTLIPLFRAVASHLNDHLHGDPSDFGLIAAHAPRLIRRDLQLCPDCMREDIDYLGFTFWRRSHQLPGIDWCEKHATALHSIGKHSNLLKQPHNVEEGLGSNAIQLDKSTEENAVIYRYSELVKIILDFKSPIAPEAISASLAEKARQKGLRITPTGSRAVLSDIIPDYLPTAWMKRHFPSLLQKKPNEFLYEYDGVCMTGGKARSSTSYILAAAVLCNSIQDGQKLFSDAINAPACKKKTSGSTKPISIRRIKSAYVECNGIMKQMANTMPSNYRSLLAASKSKGLPGLAGASLETLKALQDFYDKKAPLQEIISRPGIQVATFSEILRNAATPHSMLLSSIIHNHQTQTTQPKPSISTLANSKK